MMAPAICAPFLARACTRAKSRPQLGQSGSFELALHIRSPGHDEEGPMPHAGLNLEVDLIEAAQAEIEAAHWRSRQLTVLKYCVGR